MKRKCLEKNLYFNKYFSITQTTSRYCLGSIQYHCHRLSKQSIFHKLICIFHCLKFKTEIYFINNKKTETNHSGLFSWALTFFRHSFGCEDDARLVITGGRDSIGGFTAFFRSIKQIDRHRGQGEKGGRQQ